MLCVKGNLIKTLVMTHVYSGVWVTLGRTPFDGVRCTV